MKKVTKETLKIATRKLMMEMSEKEYDKLTSDFETITAEMEFIKDIDGVDDVEPMTFPFDVTNSYLREDVAEESISVDEALGNAKRRKEDQIVLPRVVK